MMEERYSKLEITPKLIDFGSRVVQMKLVASAGIGTVYPLRFLFWPALLVGVAVLAGGWASYGVEYNPFTRQRETRGGGTILTGVVLLFLALFFWVYNKRLVVISLAGTDRIVLEEAKVQFLETIVDRIREAMTAPADAPMHYTVNISAGTIQAGSIVDMSQSVDNSSTTVSNSAGVMIGSPGAVAVGGSASGPIAAQAIGNGWSVAAAPAPDSAPGAGGRPGGMAFVSPHSHPAPAVPAGGPAGTGGHGLQDTAAALSTLVRGGLKPGSATIVQAAPGGVAMGGSAIDSEIVTQASVGQDLTHMMMLIERSRIADQDQILEYLRLMQRLASAAPTPTSEARKAWMTFFDYAGKALTGVDGFMTLAERVHRWFSRG